MIVPSPKSFHVTNWMMGDGSVIALVKVSRKVPPF